MAKYVEGPAKETWPTVDKFVAQMKKKLTENEDDKGGDGSWKTDSIQSLLEHLKEELEELEKIVRERERLPMNFNSSQALYNEMTKEIIREAADVANMAMMVADVAGELSE